MPVSWGGGGVYGRGGFVARRCGDRDAAAPTGAVAFSRHLVNRREGHLLARVTLSRGEQFSLIDLLDLEVMDRSGAWAGLLLGEAHEVESAPSGSSSGG